MKGTQEKQVKVKKTFTGIFGLILFILSVVAVMMTLGVGAWARYVTSRSSNAEAEIAAFHFELKNINGESTATAQSGTIQFPITRTDGNTNIQAGLLAPETYGRFDIILDTTGTEVSYKYDVDVTVTNCPTNLSFYSDGAHTQQITPTRTGTGTAQNPKIATFTVTKYVPVERANDEHREVIYWDWPYETGTGDAITANDIVDTEDMSKTVTMDIQVSAIQVVDVPTGVPTVGSPTALSDISLSSNSCTVREGATGTITINNFANINSVEQFTIESSDSSVATASYDNNGTITITGIGAGNATITLTGSRSGDTKTVTVEVLPGIHVGDYIEYSPTGSYNWNQDYADQDFQGTSEQAIIPLTSGDGGTHSITTWRVLNVDNETGAIDIVPENPTSTLTLYGAQGYNNGVKLLNDACAALYSGPVGSGITARSINVEDVENAIKAGGSARETALSTAKKSVIERKQPANAYAKNKSYYPIIYERETSSVITPVPTIEQGKEKNLNQSKQTSFVERDESNAYYWNGRYHGYKQADTSIQPYQTYYYVYFASTPEETLLDKDYWVASRCINAEGGTSSFDIFYAKDNRLSAPAMFKSTGYGANRTLSSHGLFPIVSLNASKLSPDGTEGGYNKYIVNLD